MKKLILKTNEEIRTMTDPYRLKIVKIIGRNKEPMTVKQLAEIIGDDHGKVYYHVKKLEKIGAVKLSRTEKINGIIAKYYQINFHDMEIRSDHDEDGHRIAGRKTIMLETMLNDSRADLVNFMSKSDLLMEDLRDKLDAEEVDMFKEVMVSTTQMKFTTESYKKFKDDLMALFEANCSLSDKEVDFTKDFQFSLYPTEESVIKKKKELS